MIININKSNLKLSFYSSTDWKKLKKSILRLFSCTCMKCNKKGLMHVDHIKPRSKYPKEELNPKNLQVLCPNCNYSKSNVVKNDYRTKKQIKLLNKSIEKEGVLKQFWSLFKRKTGKKYKNKFKSEQLLARRDIDIAKNGEYFKRGKIKTVLRKENVKKIT